ncbi:MAG TPA: T9SS type A sorting domain-containing protein [Bacteroidales bacterium]|nr:T9SS type A sorting domain-containing protein [Bacteroidales bacterium]
MSRHLAFLLALLFCAQLAKPQDTLTVMQYNLLYYGEVTGFCNNSNNSLQMKDPHLRTILNHVNPDILTVNELSKDAPVHDHLLDNVLNANGSNRYSKAQLRNTANSNIVNMIFFDNRKLALKAQYTAQNVVRDIDVYELYYKSNDLLQGDTAFIICIVAHLKAGNTTSDANSRKIMAENTMRFVDTRFANANVMLMGDFNLYTDAEPAFQTMVNYSSVPARFIDPVGQMGNWNNNAFYASVHTQSTNVVSGDCKSGGGLDDRFDFVLISDEIRFGTKKVRYVQNSYRAIGQDGQRFNNAVNAAPQNLSVPAEVADALFNFSDHLPVSLKLRVDKVLDVRENIANPYMANLSPNPATAQARLSFYIDTDETVTIQLLNPAGQLLWESAPQYQTGKNSIQLPVSTLQAGMYLVRLKGNKKSQTMRLLKN